MPLKWFQSSCRKSIYICKKINQLKIKKKTNKLLSNIKITTRIKLQCTFTMLQYRKLKKIALRSNMEQRKAFSVEIKIVLHKVKHYIHTYIHIYIYDTINIAYALYFVFEHFPQNTQFLYFHISFHLT